MKIFAAPLQGYTEAPFRHLHAALAGGIDTYFSPFLRIEHGEVRRKDLRDITDALNGNHHLIPQIIFRDTDEFDRLTDAVLQSGFREIDLNMGCPFPPQTGKGRGAGFIARIAEAEKIAARIIGLQGEVSFSVKMRLGKEKDDEWRQLMSLLNSMPLSHVTLHPRTAREQYSGALHLDMAREFISAIRHPVVFNGEINSVDDAEKICHMFPDLHGLMLGRGLLANPLLTQEIRRGTPTADSREILDTCLRIHDSLLAHYRETLCGDAQILSKIKPYWDYSENLIGHKSAKAIHKANSLKNYICEINGL